MTAEEREEAFQYLEELDASYDEYVMLITKLVRLAAEEHGLTEGYPG